MGRQIIYTYQCDKCKKIFNDANKVMCLEGVIKNGDDETIIENNYESKEYYCEKCFKNIYIDQIEKDKKVCTDEELEDDIIIDENNILDNYIILKQIDSEKELDMFINYLGYSGLDAFQKIYKDPEKLLNTYYPIDAEDAPEINIKKMCYTKEVNIIKHVLAGIPQIIKLEVQTNKSENMAIVERKIFPVKTNG